ncbi:Lipoprotein-anchoring transpeptidase ErfK/SrfK [Sphingomonas sp. YR710]|uniref:L,D-transpeptidase family protein n=1 Tax=Sphingomonas sp. YR710 TaxID=1882773 RepID=UPI000888C36F|nr:Lipoprotein-anchoring transpeptidase ErfK/SrfK [Sphingomonas sp. YR710]
MQNISKAFLAVLAGSTLLFAEAGVPAAPSKAVIDQRIFGAQVLLDRLGFGPGVIDGRDGSSWTAALRGYQEANGLSVTGKLDEATGKLLAEYRGMPTVLDVTLTPEMLAGPFVGPIPAKEDEQAKMKALGYADAMEKLAEMYHTTPAMLAALNASNVAPAPGTVLHVPNVVPPGGPTPADLKPDWRDTLGMLNVAALQPKAAKIVVDKSDRVLRVLDDAGKLIAQFPATTGSSHDPLPIGTWKIQGISYNPTFHFNPKLFWDAKPGETKALLPAGPNGPVGVVWMDLNKAHYGIHGTPRPENIGKTESHGCIRLTNWDAARLAMMVKPGTPAIFQK